jgi:hypothetical protein
MNWQRIMQKVVEKAAKGDMQAVKFCEEIAWRQEKQSEKSGLSPLSLAEVLQRSEEEYVKHAELMTPTWLKEREKRLGSVRPPEAASVKEPETKPEPDPVAVNACDACGNARCAHGRCPACDNCEVCE